MGNSLDNLDPFDALEIIENFLTIMSKKEREISELYDRLQELEDIQNKQVGFSQLSREFGDVSASNRFTVMVADPIPASRVRLREILSNDAGCVVIGEATNGKELLASSSKHMPDFIVAEIELPTINDGYEALKKIKAANPQLTVIVLSRYVDDLILLKVMEIGAFDFMLKPINHLRLIRNVEKIRNSA